MRDQGFAFTGFIAILVGAAIMITAVRWGLARPEVVRDIAAVSPWAGVHAEKISWIAAGIVFVTAIAIPPILMMRDASDGGRRLATIGMIVCLGAFIPSMSFILGVGWFSAKCLF